MTSLTLRSTDDISFWTIVIENKKYFRNRFVASHKDFEFQYKNVKKLIDTWIIQARVIEEFDDLAEGKVKYPVHISYLQDKFGQYGRELQALSKIFFAQQKLCNEILVDMFGYSKTEFDDRGFVKKWNSYQTKNIGRHTKYS